MGQAQAIGLDRLTIDQQQVDVDRAGAVARARDAAERALDGLAGVEQLQRAKARLDADDGVQEVALVKDLADRLRLVDGRARLDLDRIMLSEAAHRLPEVRRAIPDVGAQPEPGAAQRLTSTETSSTGRGIGGSGLVARTTIPLAPKRSSSMSATAVQTRSSVR